MRNLIITFVLVISTFELVAQTFTLKDSLRFAPDGSYSRVIQRLGKSELIFGTSKSGVISYDEKTKTAACVIPKNLNGEFRDLVIVGQAIYGMVSGDHGSIDKSTNASVTLTMNDTSVFYDDVVCYKNTLMVLGDPVNGHFFLKAESLSLGSNTFTIQLPTIKNQPDEACYAASGTTAQLVGENEYVFVSGGKNSARFHRFNLLDSTTYFVRDLPLTKGEGAGPFSVFFTDDLHGVVVGGNYLQPTDTSGTCVYTEDGGKTWSRAERSPNGYRSCVTGNNHLLFACGTTGIDLSTDGGKTWEVFDSGNYCALLLEKKRLYATTNKGVCIRYILKNKRR